MERFGLESWISEPEKRCDERSEMTKPLSPDDDQSSSDRNDEEKIGNRMDNSLLHMTGSLQNVAWKD